MSWNDSSYPPPHRQRASQVLTISILIAFFVLIGLSWLWFAAQNGLLLAPTPTPTATPLAATRTPTPNVRATSVAEDMLTQVAFAATSLAQLTAQIVPIADPDATLPVAPGATQQTVQLPLVSAAESPTPAPGEPEALPAPDSPLAPDTALTATAIFFPNVNQPDPAWRQQQRQPPSWRHLLHRRAPRSMLSRPPTRRRPLWRRRQCPAPRLFLSRWRSFLLPPEAMPTQRCTLAPAPSTRQRPTHCRRPPQFDCVGARKVATGCSAAVLVVTRYSGCARPT
jgi:hypothetical protein